MVQNLLRITITVIVVLTSIPKIAEAIVDGKRAENGQFPFTAALYLNGGFTCTASILSKRTILTAAHCVVSNGVVESADNYFAMIGDVNRDSPNATQITFESVTPHPEYDERRLENDIALFQTSQDIEFTDTIQPICIASSNTPRNKYKDGIAIGWGRVSTGGTIPEMLMYVEQMILSYSDCKRKLEFYYGQGQYAADTQLCTRELKWERNGVCNGDSGGPLINEDPNKRVQVGVISYGSQNFGCGTRIIPSVNTKLSAFSDYITDQTGDNDICTI